jgi:multicomponent Na+:H+ antiporter subunit D
MRTLNEHAQTRYYLCFAITMSAIIGVAFSANLITLFLFYEIITFMTYPLVIHHETEDAYAAGNKYLFYLLVLSKAFFIMAIFLTYNVTNTFDFKPDGIFPAGVSHTLLVLVFFLFLAGIAKAAIMPFHSWLPAAMVAPSPVSALLHAVAVVNAGVFCVLRVIFHVFGVDLMDELLGVMGAVFVSFTIVAASFYALTRDNLKARLAYSTISQLSYMILGATLATPSGMAAGIMQITTHSFAKITLFLCAGALYVTAHKTKISELDGIGKRMPWTMGAFTIGSLSLIGIPPTGGFVSKWYLLGGAIDAGRPVFVLVLLVSTMLTAAYLLPIIYQAFFKDPAPGSEAGVREAPLLMLIPLLVTAFCTLILFFWPSLYLDLAGLVVWGAPK